MAFLALSVAPVTASAPPKKAIISEMGQIPLNSRKIAGQCLGMDLNTKPH